MTAISTKFRVMLLRVGECLTENDVQNLAFLCEGIKPARRELLRNSMELFVELQGRGLLNERNVSVLSSWLEELNLRGALRPLREYNEQLLQSTTELQERCIEHDDLVLKYFCVTCDSKVCSDCAINQHDKRSHDIIKIAEIGNEVRRRSFELEREIEVISELSEAIQCKWEERKQLFSNCYENVRKEIQNDAILIHEKTQENKLNLLKILDEKEISDFKSLTKEREDIERAMVKVKNLMKEMHEISPDNLSRLRKLNKAKRKCTELKQYQEQQETVGKERCVDLLYTKVPNEGACGILKLYSLLGVVAVQKDRVVYFFDERQASGGVRLVCVDPKDSIVEYWRHLVTVADHIFPVVIPGIALYYDGKSNFVFSAGKTVYNVLLNWSGFVYDSVESVSPLIIDDLDEGSWITGITVCGTAKKDRDAFVISVNNSSLLREYHVSGQALRKIDTKDYASSIIGVAYKANSFAIISRGRDSVILITAESTVKQNGSLRPPSSFSDKMLPIRVIWTGFDWMVLFVSDGKEKKWNIVIYRERGKHIKVCCNGTSCTDMDVPVSITRYRNTGFVSFADNTIEMFEY